MKLSTQMAVTFCVVCILVFSSLYYALNEADRSFEEFYSDDISRDVETTVGRVVISEKSRIQNLLLSGAYWSDLKRKIEAHDTAWFHDNATGYLLDDESYGIDTLHMESPANGVTEHYGFIPTEVIEKTPLYQRVMKNPGHLESAIVYYHDKYYLLEGTSISENDASNPEGVFIIGARIDDRITSALYDSFHTKAKLEAYFGPEGANDPQKQSSDWIQVNYSFWSSGIPSNLPVRVTLTDNRFRDFIKIIADRVIYLVLSISVPAVLVLFFYQIRVSSNIVKGIRQIDIIAQGDYTHKLDIRFSREFELLSESVNRLSKELIDRETHIQLNYVEIISIMIKTIEVSDPYTRGHSERVSHYAVTIAKIMGMTDVEPIRISGLMHDVGKIAIDSNVLNKPGKLTSEEFAMIQEHSEAGYKILDGAKTFAYTKEIIRYHHEWYDGKGYPMGLKGDEIPIESRIIAVADAFDAMTSDRAYREALPVGKAMMIIQEGSGTQFDPAIVEAFLPFAEEIHAKWSSLQEMPTAEELME